MKVPGLTDSPDLEVEMEWQPWWNVDGKIDRCISHAQRSEDVGGFGHCHNFVGPLIQSTPLLRRDGAMTAKSLMATMDLIREWMEVELMSTRIVDIWYYVIYHVMMIQYGP